MPLVLTLISLLGCLAALALPGWSDTILIFAPMLAASLWLLLRPRASTRDGGTDRPETAKTWVIVDGSNVMYWRNERPEWAPIRDVIEQLQKRGFTVGVMFDANAGYLLHGKYLHDDTFADILGLPQDQIMVVPKGTPADGYILQAARDYKARVVTNDKFRDWAARFPEVSKGKLMIKGRYEKGQLKLRI